MNASDDPPDDDLAAVVDDLDRHGREIYDFVTDYMDAHDMSEAMASHVLLGLSLNLRMLAYGLETAQPSATGLKLDLDRFRREIDDVIRDAKKGADAFIDEIKAALEDEDGEDQDGEEVEQDDGDEDGTGPGKGRREGHDS